MPVSKGDNVRKGALIAELLRRAEGKEYVREYGFLLFSPSESPAAAG